MTTSKAQMAYMQMYVLSNFETNLSQDGADKLVLETLKNLSDTELREFAQIVVAEYEVKKSVPKIRLLLARSKIILVKAGLLG
jgi:hypothetical protein